MDEFFFGGYAEVQAEKAKWHWIQHGYYAYKLRLDPHTIVVMIDWQHYC